MESVPQDIEEKLSEYLYRQLSKLELRANENTNSLSTLSKNNGNSAKNYLINGSFDIWQRGTTFNANGYCTDRWQLLMVGNTSTAVKGNHPPGVEIDGNPAYYLSVSWTSVVAPTNYTSIRQFIDDVRSLSGNKATLSFWAKATSNKGVYVYFTQNFGVGGSPPVTVATHVIPMSSTSEWRKYTLVVDIPSIAGKTLGSDSNLALTIDLDGGLIPQSSGTVDISQVKLEKGSVATDWVRQTESEMYTECYRFYRLLYACLHAGYNVADDLIYVADKPFPVPMRIVPVVTFQNIVYSNAQSLTVNAVNMELIRLAATIVATGAGYATFDLILDAEPPWVI